jgi:transposase
MANPLSVNKRDAIKKLAAQAYGIRAIRRMTGCHRTVIRRVIAEAAAETAAAAAAESAPPELLPGVGHFDRPPAPAASRSKAAAHHDYILQAVTGGVDAKNIHDRLVEENRFTGSYTSIRRYVAALRQHPKAMVGRMECLPGEEAQIDFGIGAEVRERGPNNRKKPWLFKMTLSYSRHSYERAVWRQDVATLIECMVHAFLALGGVPIAVVPDNLKAAVVNAEWYDFTEHPQFRAFAQHYGFAILPHRPRHPWHKGKVERGIDHTQRALQGLVFDTISDENVWLQRWNERCARLRIHGTHKEQVWLRFTRDEQAALQRLPATPFVLSASGLRVVHYDGFVQIEHNYYSAPAALVGRTIEARWDGYMVRLFDGDKLLRTHVRQHGRGHFVTALVDERSHATHSQLKFRAYLERRSSEIDPEVGAFVASLFRYRGLQAMRQVQGLLGLRRKFSDEQLAAVCRRAVGNGMLSAKRVAEQCRREAQAAKELAQLALFPEANEHTRSLTEYDCYAQGVANGSAIDTAFEGAAAVRTGGDTGRAQPGGADGRPELS